MLSLEAGPPGPTPQAFIRKLRLSLKRTGRLVLLEFRKEDPRVPIRPERKMSVAEVRQELEPEGRTLSAVLDVLPWQHILVLTRTDAPRRWLTRRSV